MQCQEIQGSLTAYIGNEVAVGEKEEITRHLKKCPECRIMETRLRATWDLAGGWKEKEPSDELVKGVYEKIGQTQPGSPPAPDNDTAFTSGHKRHWLKIAAGILLCLGAGYGGYQVYQSKNNHEQKHKIIAINPSPGADVTPPDAEDPKESPEKINKHFIVIKRQNPIAAAVRSKVRLPSLRQRVLEADLILAGQIEEIISQEDSDSSPRVMLEVREIELKIKKILKFAVSKELEWASEQIKKWEMIRSANKEKIQALIRQLGDNNWRRRESASEKLFEIGPHAELFLKKAKELPDPEIKARSNAILTKINKVKNIDALRRSEKDITIPILLELKWGMMNMAIESPIEKGGVYLIFLKYQKGEKYSNLFNVLYGDRFDPLIAHTFKKISSENTGEVKEIEEIIKFAEEIKKKWTLKTFLKGLESPYAEIQTSALRTLEVRDPQLRNAARGENLFKHVSPESLFTQIRKDNVTPPQIIPALLSYMKKGKEDVSAVFKNLTGYNAAHDMKPTDTKEDIIFYYQDWWKKNKDTFKFPKKKK